MIFHRAQHKNHSINVKINEVHIEQVKLIQFRGVIFDDNLDKSHVIYTKIHKGIGIICRAKMYLIPQPYLYNAFVFPYLIYCIEVWVRH